MRNLRLILVVVFCWISSKSVGQTTLGALGILMPDTITLGTPDSFFVQIQNTDSTFFSGTINLDFQINGHPSTPFSGIPMTLPPNSIGLFGSAAFNYDTLDFTAGSNIVVVWPTGTGITTSFTATKNVYVFDNTGLRRSSSQDETNIALYPNPANSTLFIRSFTISDPVEEVRIFNLLGEKIRVSSTIEKGIDISDLYSGIYLAEIQLRNQKVMYRKFSVTH